MKLLVFLFAFAASGLHAASAETVFACKSTTIDIIYIITISADSTKAAVRTTNPMARCVFDNTCPAVTFGSKKLDTAKYELTHDDGYTTTAFAIDLDRLAYTRTLSHKIASPNTRIVGSNSAGTEVHKGPCVRMSAAEHPAYFK